MADVRAQVYVVTMLSLLAAASVASVAVGALGLASPARLASVYAVASFAGSVAVGAVGLLALVCGILGEARSQTSFWVLYVVFGLVTLLGAGLVGVLSIILLSSVQSDPAGFAGIVWWQMTPDEGRQFEQGHGCVGFDGCAGQLAGIIKSSTVAALAVAWLAVLILLLELGVTCYVTHDKSSRRLGGIQAPVNMTEAGNATVSSLSSLATRSVPAGFAFDPSASLSASLATIRSPTNEPLDPSFPNYPRKKSVSSTLARDRSIPMLGRRRTINTATPFAHLPNGVLAQSSGNATMPTTLPSHNYNSSYGAWIPVTRGQSEGPYRPQPERLDARTLSIDEHLFVGRNSNFVPPASASFVSPALFAHPEVESPDGPLTPIDRPSSSSSGLIDDSSLLDESQLEEEDEECIVWATPESMARQAARIAERKGSITELDG